LFKILNIIILQKFTTSLSKNMTPRVDAKSSELVSIFHKQSGWNLARVKIFVFMISALCKVQTVGFEKLATAFDSNASTTVK